MKKLVIAIAIMLLTGCAANQRIDYAHVVPAFVNSSNGTFAVGAQDRRPYIVNKRKPEQFVGLARGGFANPFDVNTASGSPFAKDVSEVLARAMRNDGTRTVELNLIPSTSREELISMIKAAHVDGAFVLTINEWKTDVMMNASLYYDLILEEFDREGRLLKHSKANGNEELGSIGFSLDPASVVGSAATKVLKKKLEQMYSDLSNVDLSPEMNRKSASDRLKELNQLLEKGLISQIEYDQKRKMIIDGL